MIKETYFCDRCGDEMKSQMWSHRLLLYAKKRHLIKYYRNWDSSFPEQVQFYLCNKCSENMEVWLSGKNA